MTGKEWHVGVFEKRKTLRKGPTLAFRSLGIKSSESLGRCALRKMLEMRRPNDVTTRIDARSLVVKLVDYHMAFVEMIQASVEGATFINLTRHPFGQCESLMGSGLSLVSSCRWYGDIARMMADHPGREQSKCVSRTSLPGRWRLATSSIDPPACTGPRTASSNSRSILTAPIAWPRWASRTGSSSASAQKVPRIKSTRPFCAGREQLSDAQRKAIWNLTGATAARFGHTASSVLPAVT